MRKLTWSYRNQIGECFWRWGLLGKRHKDASGKTEVVHLSQGVWGTQIRVFTNANRTERLNPAAPWDGAPAARSVFSSVTCPFTDSLSFPQSLLRPRSRGRGSLNKPSAR